MDMNNDTAMALEQIKVDSRDLEFDPILRCTLCREVLCTVEAGDTVLVLATVGLSHLTEVHGRLVTLHMV